MFFQTQVIWLRRYSRSFPKKNSTLFVSTSSQGVVGWTQHSFTLSFIFRWLCHRITLPRVRLSISSSELFWGFDPVLAQLPCAGSNLLSGNIFKHCSERVKCEQTGVKTLCCSGSTNVCSNELFFERRWADRFVFHVLYTYCRRFEELTSVPRLRQKYILSVRKNVQVSGQSLVPPTYKDTTSSLCTSMEFPVCVYVLFVFSAPWLRGNDRRKLANELEDLFLYVSCCPENT